MLAALGLTLWLAGPRASEVIAARLAADGALGPRIELGRVGYLQLPRWLRGPALVEVMVDLEPHLEGTASIMDEAEARRLIARLRRSPWVRDVGLRRAFPDRFRVSLALRRPVLEVLAGNGELLGLLDRHGVLLPRVSGLDLPRAIAGPAGAITTAPVPGLPHPDPGLVAAAQVAAEWRDHVVAALPGAPRLVEVDGSNVGYRALLDGRQPEVQVVVERADGELVPLAWGHHPGSRYDRLPVAVKVEVLAKILQAHPGLAGVTGGDLRFANRWEQYLRPYRGPGPWGDPHK